MGEIDQIDQAISTYQSFFRNRKWYWPLFLYCLKVSLCNSWLLYCIFEKDCPFLEYLRATATSYLNLHQHDRRVFNTEETVFRNSCVARRVDPAVPFDGKNHLLEPDPTKSRCALCGKTVQMKCSKCGIKLHDQCFAVFHRLTEWVISLPLRIRKISIKLCPITWGKTIQHCVTLVWKRSETIL